MDEMIVVQELKTLYHLIRNHERRLDREFALAEVERIFETGTQ